MDSMYIFAGLILRTQTSNLDWKWVITLVLCGFCSS